MSINKYIIDRRENPKGKNLSNRQRFIRRTKSLLRDKVRKNVINRSISSKRSEEVKVPLDDITEPTFSHDFETGDYDFILPGNKEFVPGDKINKPPQNSGKGKEGSPDGDAEDDFIFSITREEFLDIVFEDLELPNLEEKNKEIIKVYDTVRAGFTTDGAPSQMSLIRSSRNSLGRRIALRKRQKKKALEELEKILEESDNREELEIQIRKLRRQVKSIPYIDPIDMRYHSYTKIAKPTNSAVMFCVMDVSASMGEEEKNLAKRFYLLLYLFLERKYDDVDVVFIRHHHEAKECDEEEFFSSQESGGTVVSKGFEVAKEIIKQRYNPEDWNIYFAQASDGDNWYDDMDPLQELLTESILPIAKYFIYIELSNVSLFVNTLRASTENTTNMWSLYDGLQKEWNNMASAEIENENDIIPVFRKLFRGSNG